MKSLGDDLATQRSDVADVRERMAQLVVGIRGHGVQLEQSPNHDLTRIPRRRVLDGGGGFSDRRRRRRRSRLRCLLSPVGDSLGFVELVDVDEVLVLGLVELHQLSLDELLQHSSQFTGVLESGRDVGDGRILVERGLQGSVDHVGGDTELGRDDAKLGLGGREVVDGRECAVLVIVELRKGDEAKRGHLERSERMDGW